MPNFRIPRVHRVTIQQGNLITQDMIDKLRPGMSKSQVAFVLGRPVVQNPFDSERWDYVYTVLLPPRYYDEKRLSVFFVEQHLSFFTGDFAPTVARKTEAQDSDAKESDTGK